MKEIHFVAIGANLPAASGQSARAACDWAASGLVAATGLRAACRSRWYSSAPVPASGQPRYINGVVRLEGNADPAALLAALHAMEAKAGRVRGARDAARTLDLDIIDMAGLVRETPDPVLPHPRAHLRAFVLLPLRDVAPDWVHPRTGAGIAALIAALPPQDIHAV
jgi:2-amino-4-hydroxy-6-hydroxymethyldihydropteridine diphosphokinase